MHISRLFPHCSPCCIISLEFAIHGCINASSAVNLFCGSLLKRHLMKSLASLLLLDPAGVRNAKCSNLIESQMLSSVSPPKGGVTA